MHIPTSFNRAAGEARANLMAAVDHGSTWGQGKPADISGAMGELSITRFKYNNGAAITSTSKVV